MTLTLKDLEDIEEKIYQIRLYTAEILKELDKHKKKLENEKGT